MSTLRFNTWQNTGGTEVANSTLGTGKILQVVSTTKSDTFSASIAAAGSSAVTGLTATITPSSTASKILVISTVHGATSSGPSGSASYSLTRDGTLIAQPTSPGSRIPMTIYSYGELANSVMAAGTAVYLDSPASTSSLVYGVSVVNVDSTTQTLYVNRASDDSDLASRRRAVSTITVMEVSA